MINISFPSRPPSLSPPPSTQKFLPLFITTITNNHSELSLSAHPRRGLPQAERAGRHLRQLRRPVRVRARAGGGVGAGQASLQAQEQGQVGNMHGWVRTPRWGFPIKQHHRPSISSSDF